MRRRNTCPTKIVTMNYRQPLKALGRHTIKKTKNKQTNKKVQMWDSHPRPTDYWMETPVIRASGESSEGRGLELHISVHPGPYIPWSMFSMLLFNFVVVLFYFVFAVVVVFFGFLYGVSTLCKCVKVLQHSILFILMNNRTEIR